MQYGMELTTYKRSRKVDEKKKVLRYKDFLEPLAYFIAALLISRVILINSTAPFGIALMLSIALSKEDNYSVIAGCGAIIGYITIFNNIENLPVYILIIGTIVAGSYFMRKLSRKSKLIILFIAIFLETVGYNYAIRSLSVGINILSSIFDVVCTLPLYFIIDYAITCSKEIKSKHLFSSEEIISMAIVASLLISGTWGLSVFGVSIRNIIAIAFVIVCAFVNGSATGSAAGIAVGLIVGMTTNNIIVYISVYGLSGMTVGLFKDTGKWLSAFSYMVAFFILKFYSEIGNNFKAIEAILAGIIFIGIPNKVYRTLLLEFNWEKKAEQISENYTETVKSLFVDKLKNFSDVLFNMSETVKNLVNNDKLLLKGKSSALIDNLADRVCANCNMKAMCWKRELHYTYAAFSELIQDYQESKYKLPDELERKCIKRSALMKSTEDIVNNYIINEMWRNRLVEGRQLIAGHLGNMASTVDEIVSDFNASINLNSEVERYIKKMLNKISIDYSNVFCFEDKKGRINVRIAMKSCEGSDICVKQILPVVNQVTGVSMCISDEGCNLDSNTGLCTVSFEETPKYHIASYVERECKNGENYNGDSYSFGKLKDGSYMVIISDGMGSGPEAGQESKAAVELIEKFTDAGFSQTTAINSVNSIMTMKFSEEEKFSTLDISTIDLYTGDMSIMKIGAVATYIKRKDNVDIIKSKSLPIGVLDKADIDVVDKKVKNGDIILMLSDGVLECEGNDSNMEQWIIRYLENCTENNPKAIAQDIIQRAKEVNNGKAKDDMTIVVSKVYNLY